MALSAENKVVDRIAVYRIAECLTHLCLGKRLVSAV